MILKFEQKISPKEAEILRDVCSKRKYFANLKDYLLFYNDFRNFLRTFPANQWGEYYRHYAYFLDKAILKKIGNFTFSRNNIESYEKLLPDRSYETYTLYNQDEKEYEIIDLEFGFGENPLSSGFSFFLQEPRNNNPIFSLNQFYNDWMDEELDYERDEECENMLATGLILNLATFFHNTPTLYKRVQEKLLSNRKSLTRNIGENLLNDFILLFSSNFQIKDIPIMDFSKIPVQKTFCKEFIINPNNKYIKLGTCDHCYFKNREDNTTSNWGRTLNTIKLWLDGSDRLITLINPEEMQSSGYPFLVDLHSEVFDNFVKDNISDWINQIISSTFFADNIFQNFKTRMFLENI